MDLQDKMVFGDSVSCHPRQQPYRCLSTNSSHWSSKSMSGYHDNPRHQRTTAVKTHVPPRRCKSSQLLSSSVVPSNIHVEPASPTRQSYLVWTWRMTELVHTPYLYLMKVKPDQVVGLGGYDYFSLPISLNICKGSGTYWCWGVDTRLGNASVR